MMNVLASTIVKDVVKIDDMEKPLQNASKQKTHLGMGQRDSSLSLQSWYWTCHANPAVLSYVFRSLPQELLENKSKISIAKLDCSCQFQSNPRLLDGLNFTLIILLIHFSRQVNVHPLKHQLCSESDHLILLVGKSPAALHCGLPGLLSKDILPFFSTISQIRNCMDAFIPSKWWNFPDIPISNKVQHDSCPTI